VRDNMDKTKTCRLSDRERRLVQLIDEKRFCLGRCLLMSGYARSTALTQGARVIRKPHVRRAIIENRVKRGLFCSDEELALVGKSE
jgi:hypothetical protein